MKKNVKKPLKQRLLNKYRLVVLNEETYEERISYKLTRLNIFLFIALISTLLVITTISLIAFTSIKEYIPGYDSTLLRQKAVENIETLDSLEKVIQTNQKFINSVGAVILGDVSEEDIINESNIVKVDVSELDFKTNIQDSLLRSIVEKEDRFNAFESPNSKVDGRFEIIKSNLKKIGIVDYAHSPDSLKNVLTTINDIKKSKNILVTVIGCGGDRDKTKRPIMGKIATSLSDKVIFTSDNPRNEDPLEIINQMLEGVSEKNMRKVETELNRKKAIQKACSSSNDIILVAGKGHEKYQIEGDKKREFDDKKILIKSLKTIN